MLREAGVSAKQVSIPTCILGSNSSDLGAFS